MGRPSRTARLITFRELHLFRLQTFLSETAAHDVAAWRLRRNSW
jgi:hypothetical protein